MVKTILPAHKTAVQKTLDTLSGERFESLDISVISILPLTCPKEILPHLAESFDVDINGLDEAQTRGLLQDAFQIHYYAGTPYSIKRALAIVFQHANIEEWHEYEGDEYYFRVTVESNPDATGITQTLLDKLVKTANRYKNARSLIDVLRLNLEHKGNIYVGSTSLNGTKTTIYPQNSADIVLQGNMYIALAQQSAHTITITAGDE
jgi:phage tail P2-like protein